MKTRSCVLLVVALALAAGRPAIAQDTALIAGWNIEGVDPIPQERIERIAEVIREMAPDLIVLSEVNPNDVPERLVELLGDDYQDPVILEQNATVVQNIAFVFREGVTVTGAQLLEGTDLAEEPRSRKALAANVRIGEFDFVLVGVHLKSSRDNASRNKRTRQCTAIAQFIEEATAGDEKDVLVVGDYNMIPRRGQQRNDEVNFFALSPNNFLRFVSSDFLSGKISHIDRCNPLRGNLLDGFAISRRFTRNEFIPGSTRLLSFGELGMRCRTFVRDVSDHRPIVSRFEIAEDDD